MLLQSISPEAIIDEPVKLGYLLIHSSKCQIVPYRGKKKHIYIAARWAVLLEIYYAVYKPS